MRPRLAVSAVLLGSLALVSGCADPGVAPPHGATATHQPHDAPGPLTTVAPSGQEFTPTVGVRVTTLTGGGIPSRFTIWRDPYEAKWIGTTGSGDQFYLGTQFNLEDSDSDGYVVLFLFTSNGAFKSSSIIDIGPASGAASDFDTNVDKTAEGVARNQLLSTLGSFRRTDIYIQPFAVKAYGLTFGFIPRLPDPSVPGDTVWIELLPANNMAFTPPWTYGHYDT